MGLWERSALPRRGPGWIYCQQRILAYFEGHRTLLLHLYADALSSSNSVLFHVTFREQDRGLGAIALTKRKTTPAYVH